MSSCFMIVTWLHVCVSMVRVGTDSHLHSNNSNVHDGYMCVSAWSGWVQTLISIVTTAMFMMVTCVCQHGQGGYRLSSP